MTVLRRYRARSTTMVPNCINTITRNGPGTESSDSEDVISPPWCFWKSDRNQYWNDTQRHLIYDTDDTFRFMIDSQTDQKNFDWTSISLFDIKWKNFFSKSGYKSKGDNKYILKWWILKSMSSERDCRKYPESCEAKDDDDEVNGVCQEHEHVDVGHCAVLRMDKVVEELTNRQVDFFSSDKKIKWIKAPQS